MIFLETFFMISQYFQIRKWVVIEIITMVLFAIGIGILIINFGSLSNYNLGINSTIINLTGILIGFTITSLSLISSSSNEGIKQLKEKTTKSQINNKNVSYYRVLLSRMSFTIFIELMLLSVSILIAFKNFEIVKNDDYLFVTIQMFFLLYTIYLTLNNTSSLYHTLFYESKRK